MNSDDDPGRIQLTQELRACRATIAHLDERIQYFRNRYNALASENKELRSVLSGANKDSVRIDCLERQVAASQTGVSFDYCRHVESGQVIESGFRLMRRGYLGERKNSLRSAIDEEICASAESIPDQIMRENRENDGREDEP